MGAMAPSPRAWSGQMGARAPSPQDVRGAWWLLRHVRQPRVPAAAVIIGADNELRFGGTLKRGPYEVLGLSPGPVSRGGRLACPPPRRTGRRFQPGWRSAMS